MHEREPFQLVAIGAPGGVQGRILLQIHLPMKNVHSFHADLGRFFNYGLDRSFWRSKVPVGIGGDAELEGFARSMGGGMSALGSQKCRPGGARGRTKESRRGGFKLGRHTAET